MCYFVIIGVPGSSGGRILKAFGPDLRTTPTSNPHVLAAFPAGFVAHLVTNGHCSCSLYGKPRPVDDMRSAHQHLRHKYAKKGWSEAKIARAVAQARHNRLSGLSADLVPPLQALCRAAGSLAIVVHWFSGLVEDEPMALSGGEPASAANLLARTAALAEDEVLYVMAVRSQDQG